MLIAEQVAQRESDTRNNDVAEAFGPGSQPGFLSVDRLRRQYLDYLGGKILEINEQKEARHYFHGAQWTAEEVRILRKRRQPIVTYNRVSRKINGICGLLQKLRQDPKAYPRKPGNDEGAEVATSTIRYVCDANLWEGLSADAARNGGIDGISGVELKLIEGDHGDPDVGMALVQGDEYFYDPRSFKYDFSDARWHGIAKWLDVDAAIELFPDKEDIINALVESGSDLTTYSDREFKWIYVNERRVRLVEHWYKHRGEWRWCFYISNTVLDEGISPFRDNRGQTVSRFHMFSANVDHDGDRYGFVRQMKSPQDELNQRRSRGLFLSNSKRIIARKGSVDNVEVARREWSRPDGWVEVNVGEQFDVKPDNTQNDLEAQLNWYQDAKGELESFANVQPFVGGELPTNVSGRAINMLQQGGVAELGPFILAYRDWKLRVYRAVWNIIQQFWSGERWIRITDNEDIAHFIQLNGMDIDQYGNPTIVNAVGALDVDIILDEGPDVVNMMNDTFDTLMAMAKTGASIPPQVLLELAPIQSSVKQRLIKMMQPQVDPNEQRAKELQLDVLAEQVNEKRAKALQSIGTAAMNASKADVNGNQVMQAGMASQNETVPGHNQPPSPFQMGPPAAPPAGVAVLPPAARRPLPRALVPDTRAVPPQPPVPGARLANDGRHYVPDPRRPGKWLMVG